MLRDDINTALKDAMKAGEARRVSTLRLVNATLKNADIEARGQGKPALTDDDVLGILQKMIKQRHESVELYEKGGRPELAAQEREEITIISHYLPRQMTDQEIHDTIGALLKETGATAMKDMGRVMTALKERYAGKLDFADESLKARTKRGRMIGARDRVNGHEACIVAMACKGLSRIAEAGEEKHDARSEAF